LSRARLPVPPQGPRVGKTPCSGADHSQGRLRVNRDCAPHQIILQIILADYSRNQCRRAIQVPARLSARPPSCYARGSTGRQRPPTSGEVAEWSNAPHSKCGMGASPSGVRIPPSPPSFALSGFGWQATQSPTGRRVSPEALQERRETDAVWYVYFLKLSNDDISVGSTSISVSLANCRILLQIIPG
jgi:hypothetical protein